MFRSRIFAAFLPLPLFLAIAACNRTEPKPSIDQPLGLGAEFAPLEVPVAAGSAHPQLTTSAKGALLSWLDQDEATTTLRFSERTGGSWSARKQPLPARTGLLPPQMSHLFFA